ncbi:MAG: hypothetical protein IJS61_07585 [Firmicutes bacterium]|nr:hypothetical protein [Bacillota bacterium]
MRKSFFSKAVVAAGVMASAMALSCMAVFATDYTDGTPSVSSDGTTKTWSFSSNTNGGKSLSVGDTVSGITCTGTGVKIQSGYLSLNGGSITIPVPKNSAGTIAFTNTNTSEERSITCTDTNTTVNNAVAKGTNAFNFTATNSVDELIAFSSTKESKITKITVTLTSGSYAVGTTYSATLNFTSTSSKDATVSCNGNSTVISAGETGKLELSGLSDGSTYSVTVDKYHTVDTTSFTVDGEDITKNINITEIEIPVLSEGEYTSFIPSKGFDETSANTGKYGQGEYVKFTLSNNATLTITAKCGSSSTETKSAALSYNTSEQYNENNELFSFVTQDGQGEVTQIIDLTSGIYYLVGKSPVTDGDGTTTVQIVNITVAYKDPSIIAEFGEITDNAVPGVIRDGSDYYAYVLVPDEDLGYYTDLYFKNNGEGTGIEVTEVYKSIAFEDGTIDAPDGYYIGIMYTDSENGENILQNVTVDFES